MALKQSISGIRGIWGTDLNKEIVIGHINALLKVLPETGCIIVGRDTRPSGNAIVETIINIIIDKGFDVFDAGINPTPTIEIATAQNDDAIAGIIVTASHNPPKYNGLKFLNEKGMFMNADKMHQIIDAYNAEYIHTSSEVNGRVEFDLHAALRHIDRIISQNIVADEAVKAHNFKVLYDANGGAGTTVLPTLLKRLNCINKTIGGELDGIFKHPPIPNVENLAEIGEMVKEFGADIGFATDPDADRLAIIDELGNPLSEELTLAIVADYVLSKIDSDIVINLSTSSLIDHIAKSHNSIVHRTPVGEINVSSKMLSIGAKIGGEGNGGAILPSMHPGRDAAIAAAIILSKMAESGKSVSEIIAEFPERFIVKEAVEFEGKYSLDEDALIESVKPFKIDKQDGLWLGFEDGFLHIRPSNTEPILRIIAEKASQKEAEALIKISKDLLTY